MTTSLTGSWRVVVPSAAWHGDGPELTFDGDGQVYGSGGVNRLRGTWRLEDDVLVFGPVVTTLMAGPSDAMDAERGIVALLAERLRVAGEGDTLTLTAPDGRALHLAAHTSTATV